jgi:hypothetical protein
MFCGEKGFIVVVAFVVVVVMCEGGKGVIGGG